MMASEDGSAAAAIPASPGKMPHSHSSPATVDAISLNETSDTKHRSGKLLSVNITLLDDTDVTMNVQHKCLGRSLFDLVCKHLSLLEVDYFGLEYDDQSGGKYWLDCEKPMNRQLGLSLVNSKMRFGVKFYTPDPAQLEEEYTRYLFSLQVKKDLASGTLQCNDNTAALMASYIVQADCGDYVADDYPDHTYLSAYKFVPHQDSELERRIMENHKKHVGQSPAVADLNLLETARRCELYGIRVHPAKDHEGVPLNLAVAHMGVLVFQNLSKINTFSWAKIRKLSFKRKRFLIKLHPEGYGYYKDTVEFFFDSRNECKNFWKKCVEHHGFFRCSVVKKMPRQKTRVLSRGSSFRYSGRTQKQVVEFVRDNYIRRQPFQRSQSFRHSSSAHSGIGQVGTSKSAQPLLPVGDQTVGTPASQSCGSMVLNDSGSTEALASPPMERSYIVSDDRASGEFGTSPTASPKQSLEQRERRDAEQPIVVNGVHPERQAETGWKGEKGVYNKMEGQTRSGTESPLSRSSLPQEDSSRERNEADGEDNVSQDSYQLSELEGSPRKRFSNGLGADSVKTSPAGDSDGSRSTSQEPGGSDAEARPAHGAALDGESVDGEPEGSSVVVDGVNGGPEGPDRDNKIPYVLHKRLLADAPTSGDVPEEAPPLPPISVEDAQPSRKPKPKKPPRVQVEVEHPKIMHSSPTLYARSRLDREGSPLSRHSGLSSASPKSPHSRSLDFVYVHDLPAATSFSFKDDSINARTIEKVFEERLQRRKTESSSSATSVASSSLQSTDSDYLVPLRIVEDGDEELVPERDGHWDRPPLPTRTDKVPSAGASWHRKDSDELEWEKLAPTFPPPPPPPFSGMDNDEDEEDLTEVLSEKETLNEARSKFLKGTIYDVRSGGQKLYLDELSDVSNDETYDNDASVTVEESSDTGETTVIENFPPRSLTITEQELDGEYEGGGEARAERPDSLATFIGVTSASDVGDLGNGETDSLPRDPEMDDEEVEPCHSLEETLHFPVRTLSRISEHSTSEQSESKDSTPSQESKPSEDRHPSVGELPSDYSASDDNPSECGGGGGGGGSSNDSEGSPSRGRAPGTGSGLGLSPVRGFRTTAVFDGATCSFENRYVLPDEADSSQVETYYMEIDPEQRKKLEMEGVIDRVDYGPILSDTVDDTGLTEVALRGSGVTKIAGGMSPRYEGFDVRINVVASKSPSPIKTPEPRGSDSSPGSTCSTGSRSKRRHRSTIELQVANGHILENRHASLASPGGESDSGTVVENPYADVFN